MEQKNQRNSKRKLNSLILLVAFTAIMLIVSTYAWFSANRVVTLSNLTGTVNVAQGLQISLDAENWSNEIDLSGATTLTKAYTGNKNIKPKSELKPVSTTGAVVGNMTDITMYAGTNDGSVKLTDIAAVDTTDLTNADGSVKKEAGYYAFDVFVMNTSKPGLAENDPGEKLKIEKGSTFTIGDSTSGVQNTVRVGFAKYDNEQQLSVAGSTIRNLTTAPDNYITDIAIWEPNSDAHIEGIVNNNNKLKLNSSSSYGPWSLTDGKFGATTKLPTYGLTATAATTGEIDDIYDWNIADDASNPLMAFQKTVQTASTGLGTNDLALTTTAGADFTLARNTVTRLRVFLWLEGQDVDCTNYASKGGSVELDLSLCKDIEN